MALSYRRDYSNYKKYFIRLKSTYSERPDIKAGVEVVLTFLTIAFFLLFAIRPTVNTISELLSDIKSQKEIQVKLTKKIADLQKAQVIFSKEQPRLAFLNQALPRGAEPEVLVQQIEGVASKRNVTLDAISLGKTILFDKTNKNPPGPAEFEISYTVKGSFEDTLAFLQDTENLRRTTSIVSLAFSISKRSEESGILLLTVGAMSPYYGLEKK